MSDSTPLSNGNQYVVYIIKAESGAVKIGVTNNLFGRFQHMQSNNHEKLTLCLSVECADEHQMYGLESLLHERYATQRIRGEWFNVDTDRVLEDLQFASAFAKL